MKMLNPPEGYVSIPAFIAKLWHMVSDEESDCLISWGPDGTTFIIKDHNKFSSEMLPRYYKHNNMASFIRQLNMYNFHKVVSVDSSSLINNKELEFSHAYFKRDQPNLLTKIQRKIHNSRESSVIKYDQASFNKLLQEVKQLRAVQELFSSKLNAMKKENAALWREHSILRQRHMKQEKVVNKVIQFLVSMVQQSHTLNIPRRTTPLMIKDKSNTTSQVRNKYVFQTSDEPLICEINPFDTMTSTSSPTKISPEDIPSQSTASNFKISKAPTKIVKQKPQKDKTVKIIKLVNISPNSATLQNQPNKSTVSQPIIIETVDNTDADLEELATLPVVVSSTSKQVTTKPVPMPKGKNNANKNKIFIISNDKKVNENVSLINPNLKRKAPQEIDDEVIKKMKTEIDNDDELPQILEDFILPDDTDYSTINTEPIITSPQYSNASGEEQINPIELEERPFKYFNNLLGETTLEEEQEKASADTDLSLIPTNVSTELLPDDPDDHLDKMQSELDILKNLLKGEGLSLDANTILELFNDDPIGLNMRAADESNDKSLIAYSPSFDLGNDLTTNEDNSEALIDSALNTPQFPINSPNFPT